MLDENQQNQNTDPKEENTPAFGPEGGSGPEREGNSDWGIKKSTESQDHKIETEGSDNVEDGYTHSEGDVETKEPGTITNTLQPEMKSEASDVQTPKEQNVQKDVQVPNEQIPNSTPQATTSLPNHPSAPHKIGKETDKHKSNTKFLMIMGLSFAVLFVAFIVLMVLVVAKGGENSPVLQAFGINSSGIKSFLLTVVNLSFGSLALLFFILAVIGVFKIMMAKKDDKDAKKKGIKMSLIGILPLVLIMFIWMFLYNYISTIKIIKSVKAEILITQPTVLTDLQAPLSVTFSSKNVIQSLQNNGFKITGVSWDFDGDGTYETTAQQNEMTYLYKLRGSYNVGLKVDVSKGDPYKYYKALKIGDAVFSASPTSGTAPLKVSFDATGLIPKSAKIQSLDWDFDGDGIYDKTGKSNTKVDYTFEKIGTYKVHLRFVDEGSIVQNYYRDITITTSLTPLLSAQITATPALSGNPPLKVLFSGESSTSLKGKITDYEWDLGDGSKKQKGVSVSNVYNTVGTYTVKLTVTEDSKKTDTTTATVVVKGTSSKPQAIISTNPVAVKSVATGDVPFKVSFDASGSTDSDKDIISYEWSIDGAKKSGSNIDYTFDKVGTYTVTLKVADSEKQESTATITVNAQKPGVKAIISASPEAGAVPLTVSFDASSSSAFQDSIVGYEWSFGDDTPKSVTGASITHKYNKVGAYTVSLKVTTAKNESKTTTKTIYVRETSLKACFSSSKKTGKAPLSVTFDPQCSMGTVSNYKWDFGDETDSTNRKPAHTFDKAGTYSVKLEISDSKNTISTFSDNIVVE